MNEIKAGLVPKKTKASTTVVKGLNSQRFFGLFIVLVLSNIIGDIIGGWLKILFMGFCIIVFLILTAKSPSNPTKSFYMGLLEFLNFKCGNKVYYSKSSKEYKEYANKKAEKKEKRNVKAKRKNKAENDK